MSKEPELLADQLRRAIKERGLSGYRVAKDTGIAQTAVAAFMRGGDLRLSSAEKIASYLGLELRKKK